MTIVEALTWGNNKLKNVTTDAGAPVFETPMLDAQLLMAYTLNVPKHYLFTHFDQPLSDEQLSKFESLILRHVKREPIAYIIGWKEFYNRPFKVNPLVLIPRPETELIIDEVKKVSKDKDAILLDIGTGSGIIGITLAAETGHPIIASDISPQALAIAKQNATLHKVDDQITYLEGDLLEPINEEEFHSLDMCTICANLPYLTTKQWQDAQPNVKDFEPRSALDGGIDGLEYYYTLFSDLQKRRHRFPKELHIFCEIDPSQKLAIRQLVIRFFPNAEIDVLNDLGGLPRLLKAQLPAR